MARQSRSVLAPTSQERIHINGTGDTLPSTISGHGLTREEQRTLDEYRKQRMVIEATGAKFKRAKTLIAEVDHHGVQLFVETADAIDAAKEGSRDREDQAYVDEFCNRSKKALANHLLAAQDLGARALVSEAQRPMYLMPEPDPPPKKRSVREWLLG